MRGDDEELVAACPECDRATLNVRTESIHNAKARRTGDQEARYRCHNQECLARVREPVYRERKRDGEYEAGSIPAILDAADPDTPIRPTDEEVEG